MSDLTTYKKIADFAQLSSDTNDMNRFLIEKKEFVNDHFQLTKTLIQKYYNNTKTNEQQLALSQEIKRIVALVKLKNELLNDDIKYLQSFESESKAKLLSNQDIRMQYSNESTERFLILNDIKEKEAFEKKLKTDLDNLRKYSYFQEFKRDIYVNKITFNPLITINDDLNKSNQKKEIKRKKKREELLELYHSSLNNTMKEIKSRKYQQRIDEGYIWKTINEKYKSEISINMNNFSSESISNCSSDSNDIFSIDESNSDEEKTDKSYTISLINKQEITRSKMRKLSNMSQISKINKEKEKDNDLIGSNNFIIIRRQNKSNSITNHTSFKIAKQKNDETKYALLKEQIIMIKDRILSNQKKITIYQHYHRKLKDHINYLQLKISFFDFTKYNNIKKKTIGFSLKDFSILNPINE